MRWMMLLWVVVPMFALAQEAEPAVEVESASFFDQLADTSSAGWSAAQGQIVKSTKTFVGQSFKYLVIGIVVGFLLWWGVRALGWLQADWSWYRFVRWAWLPLFVACITTGFVVYGISVGVGKVASGLIQELNVVERVGADLFLKVVRQQSGELEGEAQSKEEIVAWLKQNEMTSQKRAEGYANMRNMVDTFIDEDERIPDVLRGVAKFIGRRFVTEERMKRLSKHNTDALFLAVANYQEGKKEGAASPEVAAVTTLITGLVADVEQEAIDWTEGLARANGMMPLALSFGIPLGLVALFRLGVRSMRGVQAVSHKT